MLLINNQIVEKDSRHQGLHGSPGNRLPRFDRASAPTIAAATIFFVPNDDPKLMYRWGTMEGASRTFETMAIRMKSDMLEWPEGKTVEKYCVEPGTFCGIVMVFSTRNGEPLAIINDGIIQHMRVGGCAGLGAKYLSREDSERRRHLRLGRHGAHLFARFQRSKKNSRSPRLQPDQERIAKPTPTR